MTGPEHYAAAERCLEDIRDGNLDSDADALLTATMAQAHATLALAAATISADDSKISASRLVDGAWKHAMAGKDLN